MPYSIEIYHIPYSLRGPTPPLGWYTASEHTSLSDAELQKQRFVDSGISEENIRIVTSNG